MSKKEIKRIYEPPVSIPLGKFETCIGSSDAKTCKSGATAEIDCYKGAGARYGTNV